LRQLVTGEVFLFKVGIGRRSDSMILRSGGADGFAYLRKTSGRSSGWCRSRRPGARLL